MLGSFKHRRVGIELDLLSRAVPASTTAGASAVCAHAETAHLEGIGAADLARKVDGLSPILTSKRLLDQLTVDLLQLVPVTQERCDVLLEPQRLRACPN